MSGYRLAPVNDDVSGPEDPTTGSGLAGREGEAAREDRRAPPMSGIEPYPYRFDRSHTLAEIRAAARLDRGRHGDRRSAWRSPAG